MINKLKIVLDTNALISMLSRKLNFTNIFKALTNGEYELYITNEILLEYEEKINQFFDKEIVINTLEIFNLLPNIHKINIDPSDNKFIDCAFASNADFIVTNDKHFNILKNIDQPKITII